MIQYYFNHKFSRGWSIFNDQAFIKSRKSLDLAMKLSREEGIYLLYFHNLLLLSINIYIIIIIYLPISEFIGADRVKRRADVIEQEHEEVLWEKELLGSRTSKQLVDTLVFLFGKNFALRSRNEHRRLLLQNIVKKRDPVSDRYFLEYTEDISKTSKGGLKDSRTEPKQSRAYDNIKKQRGVLCDCTIFIWNTDQMVLNASILLRSHNQVAMCGTRNHQLASIFCQR